MRRFSEFLLWLGYGAILLMMLHVSMDVAARVFFASPLLGTLEVVENYYMVACVFLPLGYLQATRGQIVVEVLSEWMPRRTRSGLDVVALFLTGAFLLLLTYTGALEAWEQTLKLEAERVAGSKRLPVWPVRWFVVAGCGSAGFVCLITAWTTLWSRAKEETRKTT